MRIRKAYLPPKYSVGETVPVKTSEFGTLVGDEFTITEVGRDNNDWLYHGYIVRGEEQLDYHTFPEEDLESIIREYPSPELTDEDDIMMV